MKASANMSENETLVEGRIKHWLERAVIGLNLCPFAKAVHVRGQIHYAVSQAAQADTLLADLEFELRALLEADPRQRDTTLLIAPHALREFDAMLDFLDQAGRLLHRMDLEGVIQIASFHPNYQFATSAPDDIENYSNRAPYPVLHLLREESVDKAVAVFPDARAIYGANMATLRALGHDGWRRVMQGDGDAD